MSDRDQVVNLNKKKRSNTRQDNKISLYLILLVGIVFIPLFLYLVFFHSRTEIIEARPGKLVDGFESRALLVREEEVFEAPQEGRISLQVDEGVRVKKGQEVLKIDDSRVYSQLPGIISYARDGMEDLLNPGNIENISPKDFNKIEGDFFQLSRNSQVQTGDFLYRITDNYHLYLVFLIDRDEALRYREGEVVFIEKISGESDLNRSAVESINLFGRQAMISVKMNNFVREWLNMRWVEVKFIKNIHRGIVIPHRAVFNSPEGKGLLVVDRSGNINFREVEIEIRAENNLIVNNLNIGERIIANPESVDYGRRD